MSIFRRFATLLLPVALLFIFNSCTTYHMAKKPTLTGSDIENEVVQVAWNGQVFELHQPQVADEILRGLMIGAYLTAAQAVDPYGDDFAKVTSAKTHEVHIQVSPNYPLPDGLRYDERTEVAIPLTEISQVQVRELDAGLTIIKTLGGMALVAGITALVILATKDSCPFIYVMDGEESRLVGEIYSGAIHPPLERHDYLPLPVTGAGPCRLKITNEVLEIQHTNLAELLVFDHPPEERVLVDQQGRAHRIARPAPPVAANSLTGLDVRSLVADDDGNLFRDGLGLQPSSETGLDGLILTFDRPRNADDMQLIVNACNSRWLDHVLGVLFERMGDHFKPWQESQKTGSTPKMRQWSRDQGLPLKVSLLTPDGWWHVDDIELVGPIATRESVVGVDLADLAGDQVTVKIECGYRFWEIDSVGASFAADDQSPGRRVALDQAVNREGQDVKPLLLANDDRYLDQPKPGDETIMEFTLPDLAAGRGRSVILHTKGHYDILRDPKGQPDLAFLAAFKVPGAVAAYSRDLYRTLSDQAGN